MLGSATVHGPTSSGWDLSPGSTRARNGDSQEGAVRRKRESGDYSARSHLELLAQVERLGDKGLEDASANLAQVTLGKDERMGVQVFDSPGLVVQFKRGIARKFESSIILV